MVFIHGLNVEYVINGNILEKVNPLINIKEIIVPNDYKKVFLRIHGCKCTTQHPMIINNRLGCIFCLTEIVLDESICKK